MPDTNDELTAFLPPDVAKKIEVVGLAAHKNAAIIGYKKWTVDFRKISLKSAYALINAGFPFLRVKKIEKKIVKKSTDPID